MPAKAVAFPEWTPDLSGNVLTLANNVRAIGNGYAPVKDFQAITQAGGVAYKGGGAFIASDGSSTLLVHTASQLNKYDTALGWVGVTPFTCNGFAHFAQYGDNVIVSNGGQLVNYGLLTGVGLAIPTAPNAIDVAQARDFVMCITTDNALQWCQFNNSQVWTTGVNQADKQPSLWGQLKRIVGGEYIIAITDRAVVRGTYVGVEGGLDIIWQFDEISAEVGCMATGSVCNVGRLIFFLSERGFMMCDGQTVEPIADEKFNRWFFATYSRADIANMWGAIDPRNSVAMWAMPGAPGTIIAYNWVLKRATTITVDVQCMFTGYTTGYSLDALDALYGNLDAIPLSLDDPSFLGGNPILLIGDSGFYVGSLTGDNLEATFRLKDVEPTPGRRSRIRNLRPVTDATNVEATVSAKMRAGDGEAVVTAASMRTNGKMPIRANGRFNDIEVSVPAGEDWSWIQGLEVEFEAGDGR